MTRLMLVLLLHFFVVGHRGACQTLSKALLGHQMISQLVYEDTVEVFSSNLRREITREFSVRLVGIQPHSKAYSTENMREKNQGRLFF